MLTLNKNIKIILNYVVGPLVFCVLIYSITTQLQRQENWKESIAKIGNAFTGENLLVFALIIALMFINWGIEARKWQVALKPSYTISFKQSFKAIFTGTTMGFFTPNRMGEYIGRILYLKSGSRLKSIAITIVCSIAQLLITLAGGLIGVISVYWVVANRNGVIPGSLFQVLTVLAIAALIILTVLFFKIRVVGKWMSSVKQLRKIAPYIRVLDSFNATILLRILSLSGGRYLVFILQYYLIFQVFDVKISWLETFWSVGVTFLILAAIPSIALITELGIRWKASVELVRLFSPNTVGILTSSLAIWFINLVIPALIGSLLILGLKFFRKPESES